MDLPEFILGSSSKFRLQVLEEHGIHPTRTLKPDIDEKAAAGRFQNQDPSDLVLAVSRAKLKILRERLATEKHIEDYVVCCDQVVTWDGQVREKPASIAECRQFLSSYDVHPARTVAAVIVCHLPSGRTVEGIDIADQHFSAIPDHVINALIAKGDVMYCAGGLTVEDPLLAPYLGKRTGTLDSIQGMPLDLLRDLFSQLRG